MYTKSRGNLLHQKVNAATYLRSPRFDGMETFNNLARSRLNRKKTSFPRRKDEKLAGRRELSNRGCASFDWLSWPRGDSCCYYQVLPVPSVRFWLFKDLLPFSSSLFKERETLWLGIYTLRSYRCS